MRLFETIRANITARSAAEYYGIKVNRNGMACCPFHNDKHPSMKLDTRYHCFGCQADGDAIDLVGKLHGLNAFEAAKKMAEDFGLTYETEVKKRKQCRNAKPSKNDKCDISKLRKLEKELYEWKKHAVEVLDRYKKWLVFWEEFYKPETLKDEWHELFAEALDQKSQIDYYLDVFLTGTDQDCLDFSLV